MYISIFEKLCYTKPVKNRVRKKQVNSPVKLNILSEDVTSEEYEQEFVIDKSDIKLLIRALRQYKPTSEVEAGKSEILLEFFEMP